MKPDFITDLSQECKTFREIIISIERNMYSDLVGQLFCDLIVQMKQDVEIKTALYPEKAIEHLTEGRRLFYEVLTRPYSVTLTPVQGNKIMFVEMGLMDLYRFYGELLAELKTNKQQ